MDPVAAKLGYEMATTGYAYNVVRRRRFFVALITKK